MHKPGTPFGQDVWELYNLDGDPTELANLATKEPAKLKELKALFYSEGKKYHVFPLKDTLFKDFTGGHSSFNGQAHVVLYPGIEQIFPMSAPNVISKAFHLTADEEIPATGAEGVLLANGGRFGGSSMYLQNGKLNYAQTDGNSGVVVTSSKTVGIGKAKLRVKFVPDSALNANVSLFLNDEKIDKDKVPLKNGIAYFAYDEGFDVVRDLQTPVNESYKSPYAFSGNLGKISIDYQ